MKPKKSTQKKIRKMLLAGIPLAALVTGTTACLPDDPHRTGSVPNNKPKEELILMGIVPYTPPANDANIRGKMPIEPEKKTSDKSDKSDKSDQ